MNSQTRGDLKQKLKMLIEYKRKPVLKDFVFKVPQDGDEAFALNQLNMRIQMTSGQSRKTLKHELRSVKNPWYKLENESKFE
jgi:hypothetical protein